MFSTDRYSAERRINEYKNIALNNAKLASKDKKAVKKSAVSKLVSIISL
ncbi:hypothetical protein [Corticicoccus populi]|uniref:Uncharacterized protein n=1 Tax=Corticicoccus populi TaxID=1812821 RepID=A0ABW5WYV5_9STAP